MAKPETLFSIPTDWRLALAEVGYGSAQVAELLRETAILHHSDDHVFPKRIMVFRAFRETRVKDVRVVILGEDPYPELGKADGLAFSIRGGRRVDGSLKRIFENLKSDERVEFQIPVNGNLEDWARRGALLLNTALTVEPNRNRHINKANKQLHRDHWSEFIKHVLRVALARKRRVAFMLWGDRAVETFASSDGTRSMSHLVLEATHPSGFNPPGRKTRRRPFDQARHFSEANEWLLGRRVDWMLPGPYLGDQTT